MPHWRTKTEKLLALHEAAQAERLALNETAQPERWPFPPIEWKRKRMPNGAQMLEWFLWGVCMGGGWFIIQWLLGKVLH